MSDRVAAHHASDQQLRHIGVAQAIQTISHGGEPSPPRLSIGVLPLVNVGNDPEQHSNRVNGITEDLTTDLSRLESMLVISRNTALTYRDRPVDTSRIGRELGALCAEWKRPAIRQAGTRHRPLELAKDVVDGRAASGPLLARAIPGEIARIRHPDYSP